MLSSLHQHTHVISSSVYHNSTFLSGQPQTHKFAKSEEDTDIETSRRPYRKDSEDGEYMIRKLSGESRGI